MLSYLPTAIVKGSILLLLLAVRTRSVVPLLVDAPLRFLKVCAADVKRFLLAVDVIPEVPVRPPQVGIATAILTSTLSAGIPAYTGEVKIDGFRRLLTEWRPDAIISCVFGQLIDTFVIEQPMYGMYSFHPSDLAHSHGAGIAPYDDFAARGVTRTVWTIHKVTEDVDGGPVVGHSPWIEVGDAWGLLPPIR